MAAPPGNREKSGRLTLTISAAFGSDIQRDVSMRVLREFLDAWKQNVEVAHRRNKIRISEHRDPQVM